MKGLGKGRMDNPWTLEEVEVDDGVWHGDNPRGRCGDVVEADDDEEVVEGEENHG